MSVCENVFFHLLRKGLWEDCADALSVELTPEAWKYIYDTSKRQTVRGLLWDAIQTLPGESSPPQEIVWQWLAAIDAIEKNNEKMAEAIGATQRLLRQIGVEPVLMKGHSIGQLYAHPEWRECGDIDWFIPSQLTFQNVETCLREKALSPTPSADGSLSFIFHGIDIELHRQLIDIDAPQHQKTLRRLIEEECDMKQSIGNGIQVTVPSPILTLLMLNAHLMKHAFTVGVGLRQFCDIARAYHFWHNQYDADRLISYYNQLGLRQWTDLLHSILVSYLGLPLQELPCPLKERKADTQHLMRTVMKGGNFGQHAKSWQNASNSPTSIKWHTIKQIMSKMPLSMRYAPWEMICKVSKLTMRQHTRRQ